MDKYFSSFVRNFGAGSCYEAVPEAFLEKYKGILPNSLLEFWKEEGWCSYSDGLLWTVNPDDYAWLASGWLQSLPQLEHSSFYIFARSAYGEFYCLSLNSRKILTISCPRAMLVASKDIFANEKGFELATQKFFLLAQKENFDFFDNDQAPLFSRALNKLGPINQNEIYGFVPILPLGGLAAIDHLKKLRMDVHVDLIKGSANIAVHLL
jgi:hypothetical protein